MNYKTTFVIYNVNRESSCREKKPCQVPNVLMRACLGGNKMRLLNMILKTPTGLALSFRMQITMHSMEKVDPRLKFYS